MACHNVRRNALTGNDPEKVSNVQKTNQRATKETRKEGQKIYADMIICAIGPARPVPTMCHPTTIVTSLTNF